jgi:hypothetical protein
VTPRTFQRKISGHSGAGTAPKIKEDETIRYFTAFLMSTALITVFSACSGGGSAEGPVAAPPPAAEAAAEEVAAEEPASEEAAAADPAAEEPASEEAAAADPAAEEPASEKAAAADPAAEEPASEEAAEEEEEEEEEGDRDVCAAFARCCSDYVDALKSTDGGDKIEDIHSCDRIADMKSLPTPDIACQHALDGIRQAMEVYKAMPGFSVPGSCA